MFYKLCKQKGNYNIKAFVSARKYLTLTCGSSFAANLKIEVERKVIIEKLLKMLKKLWLNLPVKTTSERVNF